MKAAVFSCDGASVPEEWRSLPPRELRSSGAAPNMNMRLEGLVNGPFVFAGGLALDLVRIASYAYCADQAISRGGETDVMLEDWRRDMRLCIPVSDPDFWSASDVAEALGDALNFVSEDFWQFAFVHAHDAVRIETQPRLALGEKRPTVVALLSGGLDSAASTFAACAEQAARPFLVSHRPSPVVAHHQNAVIERLRETFPKWSFPAASPWINRCDGDAADDTQRTRSFLFLSLAACAARELAIPEVLASDNGVVSLNIPINDQLVGARASRSTHPKFLQRFNRLTRTIWPAEAPVVSNSLLFKTREEVVQMVAKYAGPGLIRSTVSCQSPYRKRAGVKHCGVCSQCVGRRFATIGARYGDYDSPDGYQVDIFADELKDGVDVTTPVSFVRFAHSVVGADPEQFWADHEEFGDAILPDDLDSAHTAATLMATLQRHSESVLRVMKEQVIAHSDQIATGDLPKRSLIALMGEAPSGGIALDRGPLFMLSEDRASLTWRGKHYVLSVVEGDLIHLLYDQLCKGTPGVRSTTLRQRLGQLDTYRLDHAFKGENRELWKREDSLIVGTGNRDVVRLNQAIAPRQQS